jgi:hypothetical protein
MQNVPIMTFCRETQVSVGLVNGMPTNYTHALAGQARSSRIRVFKTGLRVHILRIEDMVKRGLAL